MKCLHCKKHSGIINCKGCKGVFCSGCIQLETHMCSGLEHIKHQEREKLANSLPLVITPKVYKL